jgi:hypothetical protein
MSQPSDEERRRTLVEGGFGTLYETAIEDHLLTLAQGADPDVFALTGCLVRPDEAAPAIIALMERATSGEPLGDDDLVEWARPSEPVVNPFRHVGRNDPCPCGSGLKAKKCCLSGAA